MVERLAEDGLAAFVLPLVASSGGARKLGIFLGVGNPEFHPNGDFFAIFHFYASRKRSAAGVPGATVR